MAANDGKATRFPWLYVARCVVASVVTVAAVFVILRAVVVMLRPEKLQLKLSGGCVHVDRFKSRPLPGSIVKFGFTLTAYNPSGRASIIYTNVTVRLIDVGGASSPAPELISEFDLPQIPVPQQTGHDALVTVILKVGEDVPVSYAQALYDDVGSVGGAALQVDGLLSSHMAEGISRRDVPTTYYCRPVAMAVGGGDASSPSSDTTCYVKSEAPAFP